MWPWQFYFRFSCQSSAEDLFNRLDRGLEPNVFIIGFLRTNRTDRQPICIDPEVIDFSLDEFRQINQVAEKILNADERKDMFYTGVGIQEEMDQRLRVKSFRLGIEEIINTSANKGDKISFVSESVMVDDFEVFVVLQLNEAVYHAHNHLTTEKNEQGLKIYRSLLEKLVESFLSEKSNSLYFPNPGKNLSGDGRKSDELLREAAFNFMYTISVKGKAFEGLHGLFDACNKLSIAKYEGTENHGHIIVTQKDHSAVEMVSVLETPFTFRDFRKVRKLLQLSSNELGMICNTNQVLGLGKIKESYDPSSESVFSVHFKGIHCWDVSHSNKTIMRMRYGIPDFETELINERRFLSDAQRIFSGTEPKEIQYLLTLAFAVTRQANGALLIISDKAREEASRLSTQCFPVKPEKLSVESLLNLSAIDGGVLINQEGIIYAYGVILDGVVKKGGTASRGSRYNSAVTYQEFKGATSQLMLVIVSEDHTVDIIPSLRPQIRHTDITDVIQALERLADNPELNVGNFNKMMEWLNDRKFYLNKQECERVNSARTKIEGAWKNERSYSIKYENLTKNPEMNESYYSK